MRRALSSLLVAVFAFLAAAPAIFADDASAVPACCRRFGKHRCSMYESGELALKGVCPAYSHPPAPAVSPNRPGSAPPATSAAAYAPQPSRILATVPPAPVIGAIFEPGNAKRGPPAVSL